MSLTAEKARSMFAYDAETGVMTRRKTTAPNAKAGDVVGWPKSGGYVAVSIAKRTISMHRLIWLMQTGEWPSGDIDHINGIGSDNRWCNLRDVPTLHNVQNVKKARKDSKTGIMGVRQRRGCKTFFTDIRVDGKAIPWGTFKTAEEASRVYLEAKRRLHAGCTI